MLDQKPNDSRHGRAALLASIAAVAVIAYVIMNQLLVKMVVRAHFFADGIDRSLVYVLWLGCGFIVFSAVLLTARRIGLLVLLIVSCISVATNFSFAVIVKQDITPDFMEWIIHETRQLPQAWVEFRPEILLAILKTVALLAVFMGIRTLVRRHHMIPADLLLTPRARAIALASFLGFHGAAMLIQPSYTVAETNIFVFGLPASMTTLPQRRSVPVRPEVPPRADKIVFILDESVGHKIYVEVIAPTLRHLPVVEFGEAAAMAACSAASNALLRWGLEKSRISEPGYDARTNPTIWAYAKAAGFKTTLVDGQSKGAKQNFLSSAELALIDEFIPADVGMETDLQIAAMLSARLSQPGRELIYVIKRGSHFPYEMNYPKGTLSGDAPKTAKYAAAVFYSTGGFFPRLTEGLSLANILLIYTSDHGQNLESRAVHCSGKHHPEEYSVPLMVLSEIPSLKALLSPAVPRMRDRASHVNIFPTLLYGLGYSKDWIETVYGPTLAGPPSSYVTVAGWLPHPTRRKSAVEFVNTPYFPGREDMGSSKAGRDAAARP